MKGSFHAVPPHLRRRSLHERQHSQEKTQRSTSRVEITIDDSSTEGDCKSEWTRTKRNTFPQKEEHEQLDNPPENDTREDPKVPCHFSQDNIENANWESPKESSATAPIASTNINHTTELYLTKRKASVSSSTRAPVTIDMSWAKVVNNPKIASPASVSSKQSPTNTIANNYLLRPIEIDGSKVIQKLSSEQKRKSSNRAIVPSSSSKKANTRATSPRLGKKIASAEAQFFCPIKIPPNETRNEEGVPSISRTTLTPKSSKRRRPKRTTTPMKRPSPTKIIAPTKRPSPAIFLVPTKGPISVVRDSGGKKVPLAPSLIEPSATSEQQQEEITSNNRRNNCTLSQLDSDDTSLFPPSIECLESQCWVCHVSLKTNKNINNNATIEGGSRFYAMHAHPLLQVPTCSVCADTTYAIEAEVQQQEQQRLHAIQNRTDRQVQYEIQNVDDPDRCSGCAKGEELVDTLLLCDNCPRTFCVDCVAQAHGGGTNGALTAKLLLKDDSDNTWNCPHCDMPLSLTRLVQALEETSKMDNNIMTPEELMEELDDVECELQRCEQVDEEFMNAQREEMKQELESKCKSAEELHDCTEEEMALFEKVWKDHHLRLMDYVTFLQDELDYRGTDLLAFYNSRKTSLLQSSQEEPDWKKRADQELDKRCAKFGIRKGQVPGGQPVSNRDVYDRDLDDEVEIDDLNTGQVTVMEEKNESEKQWSNHADLALEDSNRLKEKYEQALRFEKIILEERNIILKPLQEEEDQAELILQHHSNGGRVRRNKAQMVCRKASPTKRPLAKQSCSYLDDERSKTITSSKSKATMVLSNKRKEIRKQIAPSLVVNEMPGNSITSSRSNAFDKQPDLMLTSPEMMMRKNSSNVHGDKSLYRTVSVASHLVHILKEHQVDGIKFMWRNACSDLYKISSDAHESPKGGKAEEVGGCILAHNMGLGKTLQVITLLHTLFNHPSLELQEKTQAPNWHRRRIIHTALIVVPTNTITNWQDEFEKWVGGDCHIYNLNSVSRDSRLKTICTWVGNGGILLVSNMVFSRIVKDEALKPALQDPGPDIVVLDEAHTMIRSNTTEISKALRAVRTQRRIALTGTPLQNNLMEYFHMTNWVRTGCLGSEAAFDKAFNKPIMNGMASDSSPSAVALQIKASKDLHQKLLPFVHRRDNSALQELKPLQQVVLHVRQTKMQAMLFRLFTRVYKTGSFLDMYHKLSPVQNHPGCLVLATRQRKAALPKKNVGKEPLDCYIAPTQHGSGCANSALLQVKALSSADKSKRKDKGLYFTNSSSRVIELELSPSESDEDQGSSVRMSSKLGQHGTSETTGGKQPKNSTKEGNVKEEKEGIITGPVPVPVPALTTNEQWWQAFAAKKGKDSLMDINNGYKVVLLLQILTHAQQLGDKVVVFSKCLKTLDFLEHILNQSDWGSLVPAVTSFDTNDRKLGPWRKNIDYLRIDGAVSASERGELITSFNDSGGSILANSAAIDSSKLFLISIEAGGIGINLTAANRVVLFDCHWNPAVMTQALYRCYRYGQTKPVYAYRFITEGSMEEKIYSRSVNKSGLAARVIDQHFPDRNFTANDLNILKENDVWACCELCNKWRMLPDDINAEELPELWYCELLSDCDPTNANCEAEEKDKIWYSKHFERLSQQKKADGNTPTLFGESRESIDEPAYTMPEEAKIELVRRDEILSRLLSISTESEAEPQSESAPTPANLSEKKTQVSYISKYYFHDVLLKDRRSDGLDAGTSQEDAAYKHTDDIDATTSEVNDILDTIFEKGEHDRLETKMATHSNSGKSRFDNGNTPMGMLFNDKSTPSKTEDSESLEEASILKQTSGMLHNTKDNGIIFDRMEDIEVTENPNDPSLSQSLLASLDAVRYPNPSNSEDHAGVSKKNAIELLSSSDTSSVD